MTGKGDTWFPWTEAQTAEAARLWARGWKAAEIAKELGSGLTRNAVIGRMYRIGASTPNTSGRPRPEVILARMDQAALEAFAADCAAGMACAVLAEKYAMGKSSVPRVAAKLGINRKKKRRRRERQEAAVVRPRLVRTIPVEPSEARMVTLMQLRADDCRWPVGEGVGLDQRFCGCRKFDGLPYCEYHARIAYRPIDRAERRDVRQVERLAA